MKKLLFVVLVMMLMTGCVKRYVTYEQVTEVRKETSKRDDYLEEQIVQLKDKVIELENLINKNAYKVLEKQMEAMTK